MECPIFDFPEKIRWTEVLTQFTQFKRASGFSAGFFILRTYIATIKTDLGYTKTKVVLFNILIKIFYSH